MLTNSAQEGDALGGAGLRGVGREEDGLLDEVVLIDELGRESGRMGRSLVHSSTTPRHLAFSLYLINAEDQLLMTRRALTKRTWPGVWTNSCCGHPQPGEPFERAIERRLDEELHVRVLDLSCVLPAFSYTAQDASGMVENELCPVFTGRVHPADAIEPRGEEVMDWSWAAAGSLGEAMALTPFAFSPWSVSQMRLLQTGHHLPAAKAPAPPERGVSQ